MTQNELLDFRPTPADFELVQKDAKLYDADFSSKPIGFFKDAMVRLIHNKAAVAAMTLIVLIIFMAIFGPGMTPYDYVQQNVTAIDMPPRIPALSGFSLFDGHRVLANRRFDQLENTDKYPAGSVIGVVREFEKNGVKMCDVEVDYYLYSGFGEDVNFWFGTDYLGRDLWTRLWRGARISLLIAAISVAANICIGIVYGAIAGYYGGKVDMVMMRFTEIIAAFPQSIVATMLILVLGTGMRAIIIALIVRGWVGTARLIRAQFLRFKGREYVLAARSLGVPDKKLIFRHILPNSIGPIITKAMIEVPAAIFSESFLAFIGLGIQAPEPSIGVLLSDAQKVLTSYPYKTVFPAVLISVLMISFNLFGNGLRDAFDPTMRGVD